MCKIVFLIFVLAFSLGGCGNSDVQDNSENSAAQSSRLSTSSNTSNTDNSNSDSTNNTRNNNANTDVNNKTPTEKQLATFTTKIRTKDENRNNNISITCSKLNGTVVDNGETFSFCDTVGKATKSEGYEEAKTFVDGKLTYGVGGGNCQVSSTLYNAVLEVKKLKVVERHPHSANVPYVEEGKDAAVATGSYDFKFKNNTGKSIKIYATSSDKEVTITLNEL